jgi:hypothetical protein
VKRVFLTEPAVLVHFKPVGVVFLVFHRVVVTLLALGASQSNFHSHDGTSRFTEFFSLPPSAAKKDAPARPPGSYDPTPEAAAKRLAENRGVFFLREKCAQKKNTLCQR